MERGGRYPGYERRRSVVGHNGAHPDDVALARIQRVPPFAADVCAATHSHEPTPVQEGAQFTRMAAKTGELRRKDDAVARDRREIHGPSVASERVTRTARAITVKRLAQVSLVRDPVVVSTRTIRVGP